MNQRQCTIAVFEAALILALAGCLTEPIAGAYARIAKDDEEALAAYTFLREELTIRRPEIMLGNIRVAYRQVVAGYNIRLKCEYRTTSDAKTRILKVVVYFDLQSGRKLTQLVLD